MSEFVLGLAHGRTNLCLCRLIYKVKGPTAQLNFELSAQERAQLDCLTTEQVVKQLQREQSVRMLAEGNLSRGSSFFRGVSIHKLTQKWQVSIGTGGKHVHLGIYDDETEAARAYDAAALQLHGRCGSP